MFMSFFRGSNVGGTVGNSAAATTTTTTAFAFHPTIRPLLNRYDGFILDQFGVLHNGSEPLEGVLDCLEFISQQQQQQRQQKKKMIVLSNTSSLASTCLSKLKRMGSQSDVWFQQNGGGAVTSGEEACKYIRTTYGKNGNKSNASKKKALWLTYAQNRDEAAAASEDGTSLAPAFQFWNAACGNNVELATSIPEADFIIAHGPEVWFKSLEEQETLGSFLHDGNMENDMGPFLDECATHCLPFICANPDLTVKVKGGRTLYMPGLLSKYYRQALIKQKQEANNANNNVDVDSLVLEFGKPNAEHFEACLRNLGLDRDRVCMVGDSLHHDIKGAQAAGIDSVLVASYAGVHAQDLNLKDGTQVVLPNNLEKLFLEEGITPTHVIPSFRI